MASRNLGSLTIDLIARTLGFEQGMDKASRTAAKRSKEIQSSITGSFKTIAASVAGFVAGLALVDTAIRGLNQAIDQADQLDELSARYDISTEKLSAWGYAAKLTGSDLDSLTSAIPKFSKVVADAADETSLSAKVFDALGISVKDQAGNLRTFQDLLPEVADRFQGITDQTLKTNLALQLFGKSGAQFLEFLNLGSGGLQAMEERAKSLGIVISGDTASAAAAFNDRVDDLKAATQGLFTNIASQLLPALTSTTREFTDLVKSGDLAANAVTVISSAMSAGVGVINGYNRAVFGLSLTMEATANAAKGLWEANKNLLTFGAADGTVVGGFKRIQSASDDATASWNAYIKAQQAAAAKASGPFAGVTGHILGTGDYEQLAKQEQAAKDAAAAQEKLQKLLGDPTGANAKAAERDAERIAKAIRKMADIQREWTTDLNDTDNPILDEYARRLDEIKEKAEQFSSMGVPAEKIKSFTEEMQKLAASIRDKDLAEFQREFGLNTEQLANSIDHVSNAAVDYERAVYDLDKQLKQGLITQDQYSQRLATLERQRHADATTLLEDLAFEEQQLGRTNSERQAAIALRGMDAETAKKFGEQIRQMYSDLEAQQRQVDVLDDLRSSFGDFFSDVLSGNKSITESFKDMLSSISDMIAKRIAQNWVDQLFGQSGTSQGGAAGGWGEWLGTFASWFAGGKANGGWADANSIYEVNERGFEMANVRGRQYMLTGDAPVRITPNHKLGGGGGLQQSNTYVIHGDVDRRTQAQIAQEVGRRTQVAMGRNA